MLRSIFLFTALTIGALSAAAQTGTLTGIVSDAITGEALIQATVRIGNTGVATDFDGKYAVSLPYGSHEITVQYIGYESKTRTIEINRQLVQSNFKLSTIVLQEAQVVADVAIERETPVAFSNIKPVQIQEELGSQPIPMILNSTPGVYATQAGSDDNGPSISIRGFKQRNVSVLVDGIPVNDMESGAVFWNNWFGLDLVTQTMQVQRGLGASKLALPAIGGTVNIVTSGIESSRKTSVKQEFGSFGFSRTSIGHTSGRLDGGWGYTMAGSFQNRQGYFQQDYNRAFFYYVKVQKALGNHTLSVSATGSPSQNAARGYQQRIATHNKEYARSLFEGTDEEYAELMAYSQGYDGIFNDGTLLQQEELAAYDSLNQAYGYGSSDDFEEIVSSTDFIDTTGIVSYGDTYNVHWGEVNNNVLYERQNKYHKPLFSVRHSWRATEKLYISNMAYAS
ncbi:MAG: TonB-dependent receptor [Flavobacteriales bacterium]|nr:TonB-dependent receptor [Flavobacteriales bacterium]